MCQNWNRVLLSLRLSLHSPVSAPPATGETGKVEKKAGQKIFQINSPSWCVPLCSCKTHQLTSRWGKAVPNWMIFGQFFPFQLFERRTKGAFYLVSLTQGVSLMITTITLWWYFQRSCLESSVHQRSSTWRCYRSAAPSSRECKSQVFYKYIFACKLCALKFSNTISTFKSAKKVSKSQEICFFLYNFMRAIIFSRKQDKVWEQIGFGSRNRSNLFSPFWQDGVIFWNSITFDFSQKREIGNVQS